MVFANLLISWDHCTNSSPFVYHLLRFPCALFFLCTQNGLQKNLGFPFYLLIKGVCACVHVCSALSGNNLFKSITSLELKYGFKYAYTRNVNGMLYTHISRSLFWPQPDLNFGRRRRCRHHQRHNSVPYHLRNTFDIAENKL